MSTATTEASTAPGPGNQRLASRDSPHPLPVTPAASASTANATEYEVAVAMAPTTNAPSPVPASKLRFQAMLTDCLAGSPAIANACVSVRFCRPPYATPTRNKPEMTRARPAVR